jgi:hypothetical protein
MNPEINQNNQNYDELINQLLQKHIFDKEAQSSINNNQDNTPEVKDEDSEETVQDQDIDNNPNMDQNRADKLTVANQNPNEVDPDEIANREINTASL